MDIKQTLEHEEVKAYLKAIVMLCPYLTQEQKQLQIRKVDQASDFIKVIDELAKLLSEPFRSAR